MPSFFLYVLRRLCVYPKHETITPKSSNLSMIREENSNSFPIDLIIEILSRLPAKSIARCRCVSKLWASILHRPYFTELFLIRSLARPRLLFALERAGEWCFLTSPQPHNPYGNKSSSLVVATTDFQMKCPGNMSPDFCGLVSGLIYFHHMPRISKEDKDIVPVPMICNPSTGQYVSLPSGSMKKYWRSFLGFDPIDKQIKVLSMNASLYGGKESLQILTLGGTENVLWRKIHCPLDHFPTHEGVCINGVLYYLGIRLGLWARVMVCFDVRSEKFKFIENEFFGNQRGTKLINYKGKLGGITWSSNRELRMWVINDVDKSDERSHYSYIFSEGEKFVDCDVSVVGVTTTGEIVLSMDNLSKPFYVFYVNLEKNTLQSVEIQGFGANHEAYEDFSRVKVFVDHVENLNFLK